MVKSRKGSTASSGSQDISSIPFPSVTNQATLIGEVVALATPEMLRSRGEVKGPESLAARIERTGQPVANASKICRRSKEQECLGDRHFLARSIANGERCMEHIA